MHRKLGGGSVTDLLEDAFFVKYRKVKEILDLQLSIIVQVDCRL